MDSTNNLQPHSFQSSPNEFISSSYRPLHQFYPPQYEQRLPLESFHLSLTETTSHHFQYQQHPQSFSTDCKESSESPSEEETVFQNLPPPSNPYPESPNTSCSGHQAISDAPSLSKDLESRHSEPPVLPDEQVVDEVLTTSDRELSTSLLSKPRWYHDSFEVFKQELDLVLQKVGHEELRSQIHQVFVQALDKASEMVRSEWIAQESEILSSVSQNNPEVKTEAEEEKLAVEWMEDEEVKDLLTVSPKEVTSDVKKPKDQISCDVCGKEFEDLKLKRIHDIQVHGPKVTCPICFARVPQGYPMTHHIKERDRVCIRCRKCDVTFRFHADLKKHAERFHSVPGASPKQAETEEGWAESEGVGCELCGKALKNADTLRRHLRLVHVDDLEVPCDTCGKKFKSETHLRYHMKNSHSPKISCSICGYNVAKHLFNWHMKQHRKKPVLRCGRCAKVYTDVSAWKSHQKRCEVPQSGLVFCQLCEKDIEAKDYGNHKRELHGQNVVHKCLRCGKIRPSKKALLVHMKNVHGPKVRCPVCNVNVGEGSHYAWHLKQHEKHPVVKCEKCGKILASLSSLKLHEKRVHGGPSSKVICEVCGKAVLAMAMKTHLATAHPPEGQRFACPECGKEFKREAYVTAHVKNMHSTVRFLCPVCGKDFRSKATLQQHVKSRHEEPTLQCPHCEKKFALKEKLNHHVKKHENVRPFQCGECPKAFFIRKTLNEHMNTHLGLRPHVCETCGSAFAHSGALYTHVKLKHKGLSRKSTVIGAAS